MKQIQIPVHYQTRIEETLYFLQKVTPETLVPVLASRYSRYSYSVARQQLQQLANALSTLSICVSQLVIEEHWNLEVTSIPQVTSDDSTMLTVTQVATKLNLSKQKVYDMIARQQLAAVDINSGTGKKPMLRVRQSDVNSS